MGTSLLTNQSAMTALQTLRQVGKSLDTTQQRVSTGLRINQASDNTAYWSISSMMRSDRNALSAVSDAMSLGKSQVDVANATIEQSKGYLDNIQKSLATVYEKGDGDVQKIQADIKGNINNIASSVQSASLAEKNILANDGQNVRIAGAYRREGSSVYVDMIDVGGANLNFAKIGSDGAADLSEGMLKGVFGKSNLDLKTLDGDIVAAQKELADANKANDQDAIDAAETKLATAQKALTDGLAANGGYTVSDFVNADLSGINAATLETVVKHLQGVTTEATSNVVTAGSELGAVKNQIDGQIDYVGKLMDSIDKGIGSLVDADMNAESARLASLQVQQQLGIQALSIANQNSQNILSLFRN